MTAEEALTTAKRAARAAGYRLEDFERARVTSDEDGWTVPYTLKPPGRPGGHFTVRVTLAGEALIMPGR